MNFEQIKKFADNPYVTPEHEALYGWLEGKTYYEQLLLLAKFCEYLDNKPGGGGSVTITSSDNSLNVQPITGGYDVTANPAAIAIEDLEHYEDLQNEINSKVNELRSAGDTVTLTPGSEINGLKYYNIEVKFENVPIDQLSGFADLMNIVREKVNVIESSDSSITCEEKHDSEGNKYYDIKGGSGNASVKKYSADIAVGDTHGDIELDTGYELMSLMLVDDNNNILIANMNYDANTRMIDVTLMDAHDSIIHIIAYALKTSTMLGGNEHVK